MASNYPGMYLPIDDHNLGQISYDNNIAHDVRRDFQKWPEYGDWNAVRQTSSFPSNIYKSGINNHFQGIQRLSDGKHFIITGGVKKHQQANLIIKKYISHIPSRNVLPNDILENRTKGPIGSNILTTSTPSTDLQTDIINLERGRYWHAGGFSTMGDLLIIPIEGQEKEKKYSKVLFVNCKDVNKITRISTEIQRTDNMLAGAASGIKMDNGHFLIIVWTDSDDYGLRFDLYLSKTTTLLSGFDKLGTIKYHDIIDNIGDKPKFQSIHLVKQSNGSYYLLGFFNTNKEPFEGTNKAYLFKVFLDSDLAITDNPKPVLPIITYLQRRKFSNGQSYYDMRASSGVYVSSQGEMILYAGHYFRDNDLFKFAEFCPMTKKMKTTIQDPAASRIELYAKEHFRGRCLKLYGRENADIQDYSRLNLHGDNFIATVCSARYCLPENYRYALYTKKNYQGYEIDLIGRGQVIEIPTLRDYNRTVSSSKFLRE